jgi:hypothetical protein
LKRKESAVIGAIVIVALTGGTIYTWLTAVTLPVLTGLKASLQAWWGDGWRGAFPLAVGIGTLVTAVPAAAAMLLTISDPPLVLYALNSPFLQFGAVSGAALWFLRAAVAGVPRLPEDIEIELALAVVALEHTDPGTLSSVEQRYHHYMLTGESRPAHAT